MAASSIRPTRSVAQINSDTAGAGAGAARQLAAGGALPGAEGARSPLALRAGPIERGWRVEQRRVDRRVPPAADTSDPNRAAREDHRTARGVGAPFRRVGRQAGGVDRGALTTRARRRAPGRA